MSNSFGSLSLGCCRIAFFRRRSLRRRPRWVEAGIAILVAITVSGPITAQTDPPQKPQIPLEQVDQIALAAAFRVTGAETSHLGTTLTTFLPDQFTGSLTASVPIPLPAGRNSMTPTADLRYRTSNGEGWVGVGWELELGTIERSARDGVDFAGDAYVFRSAEGAIDLVRHGGFYRYKIEQAFTRFSQTAAADVGTRWLAEDRTGRKYFFGTTRASRSDHPSDGMKIYQWRLDRIEDPDGNSISYEYAKDGGTLYPRTIRYVNDANGNGLFEVRFHLEDRPALEHSMSFAPGFALPLAHRLRTIEVIANGAMFSAHSFEYRASVVTGRSLLTRVITYGRDAVITSGHVLSGTAAPPRVFDYTSLRATNASTNIPLRLETPGGPAEWPDFNGDGRADYCRIASGQISCIVATANGFSEEYRSAIANFDSGYPDSRAWVDMDGDGRSDYCRIVGNAGSFQARCTLSTGTGFNPTEITSTAMGGEQAQASRTWVDLNGDGRTDFCRAVRNSPIPLEEIIYESQIDLIPLQGMGPGFVACRASLGTSFATTDFRSGEISLGQRSGWAWSDFNGDRLLDFCRVTTLGTPVVFPPPPVFVDPNTITGISCALFNGTAFNDVQVAPSAVVAGQPYGRAWTDVNGDGLGDYCRVSGSAVQCALSNRDDLQADFSAALDPGAREGRAWVDANGDGRADYCRVLTGSGEPRCSSITAGGPHSERIFQIVGSDSVWERRWADVDGDGALESCRTHQVGPFQRAECYSNRNGSTDLLTSASNGIGGNTRVEYRSSTEIANRMLPFALPTAFAIIVSDGRGIESRAEYDYQGGFWNREAREFRGFSSVIERGQVGLNGERRSTETFFHQGDSVVPSIDDPDAVAGIMKGKPYRVRVSDENNRTLLETETTYRVDDDGAGPFFNPIERVIGRTCTGGDCSTLTNTSYEYDAFGNIVAQREYGRSDDLVITSRTVVTGYEPNEQAWILSLPTTEKIYAGQPAVVLSSPCPQGDEPGLLSCIDYYYDGTSSCDVASTTRRPERGRLTRVVRWNGAGQSAETRAAHGSKGEIVCSRDPRAGTTLITYDPTQSYALTTTTPAGFVTRTRYYGVDGVVADRGTFGQPKSAVDPNGAITTTEYDPLGRIVRISARSGLATDFAYREIGSPERQRIVSTAAGLETTTYVDGLGRTYSVLSTGPNGRMIRVDTQYDARGLVTRSSQPFFDRLDSPAWTEMKYDALGRPTDVLTPSGGRTLTCYNGWVSSTLDALGRRMRVSRDAAGNVAQIAEYAGQYDRCTTAFDAPLVTTRFEHDELGRIVAVVDSAGNTTRHRYDFLGRRLELAEPDSGVWRYQYDASGNLVSQIDGAGREVISSYDAENRVERRMYRDPAGKQSEVTFAYDDQTVPFGKTRLTRETVSTGSSNAYAYDADGRVVAISRQIDGRLFTTTYAYDPLGRQTAVTLPDAAMIRYAYDGPFLRDIRLNNTHIVTYTGRDAAGRALREAHGNGVVTDRQYCRAFDFALCSQETRNRDQVLESSQYRYDAVGNLTFITDAAGGSEVFAYDDLDRLVASEGLSGAVSIAYDSIGNIKYRSDEGRFFYGATGQPNVLNRVGDEAYTFDASGNETRGPGRTIEYDGAGRPERLSAHGTVIENEFGPDGERIRRELRKFSVWPPPNLFRSLVGQRSLVSSELRVGPEYRCIRDRCYRYIWAEGQLLAIQDEKQRTYYLNADHRGSVTLVTGDDGQVRRWTIWSPFGEHREGTVQGLDFLPRIFAGHELDADASLVYMGFRYYDPTLGRFIGIDRGTPGADDSQLLNRYAYARNNPLSYVDPDGEFPILAAIIAGAVLGGLQAGMNSDWNGEAILRGVVIGAVVGGVSGGVGLAAGPVVGGAAGGATGAFLTGGDVGRGAVFGALGGAIGAGASEAGLGSFGGAASGAFTSALAGENVAEGALFGFAGAVIGEQLAQAETPEMTTADIVESEPVGAPRVARSGANRRVAKTHKEFDWAAEKARVAAYDKPVQESWSPIDFVTGAVGVGRAIGLRLTGGSLKNIVGLTQVHRRGQLLHLGYHPTGGALGRAPYLHLGVGRRHVPVNPMHWRAATRHYLQR